MYNLTSVDRCYFFFLILFVLSITSIPSVMHTLAHTSTTMLVWLHKITTNYINIGDLWPFANKAICSNITYTLRLYIFCI